MFRFVQLTRHSSWDKDGMSALGLNLSLLCSFQPSIAEVCRRIGINRQQFNKYLNGSASPSRRNLRAICDFFGVTDSEIVMDHDEFSRIVSLKSPANEDSILGPAKKMVEHLLTMSEPLDRYEGFYFRYFPSYGSPGKFVKSLGRIKRAGHNYFWKNNETLRQDDGGENGGFGKWHGIFLSFADRIYLVEYDTATTATPISSSVFYQCHRSRVDFLSGVQTGAPLRRGRRPAVSRVVLEYLGKEVDVRECIAKCGLLRPGNPELDARVLSMLSTNETHGGLFIEADEY